MNEQIPVLQVEGLTKHFPVSGRKVVHAVDDVSFSVLRGKTLGLVGESGCGKSSCARTIIRIYEPTAGKILIDGEDISDLNQKQLLPIRKKMQMIFQDPYASLNARMTVHDIIAEPLRAHQVCTSRQEENERISDMLARVGLNRDHANRYAHEFSGGQRQRVGIARALILKPELVICDEPISALDVSIQAQVVNMLRHFQEELGLTYLFIAHDLAIVKHISQRIGVMYLGHMVELTTSAELYRNPLHPYTQMLLSAIPIADPDRSEKRQRILLKGEIPSPLFPPSGCPFRTRCPKAEQCCAEKMPELRETEPGHFAACHML